MRLSRGSKIIFCMSARCVLDLFQVRGSPCLVPTYYGRQPEVCSPSTTSGTYHSLLLAPKVEILPSAAGGAY